MREFDAGTYGKNRSFLTLTIIEIWDFLNGNIKKSNKQEK